MFPTLFGPGVAAGPERTGSEAILAASLAVAERGEQVRSQFRGAIVEELTAILLARRTGDAAIRRERRILFDGVRAEIHPYDVTVEREGATEAYDCKWGARGINDDVLHQLDDARATQPTRTSRLAWPSSCSTPIGRARCDWAQYAPHAGTSIVTIESMDRLAAGQP